MANPWIITTAIWTIIYLIVFLLRNRLDFGKEKGYHLHWIVGFALPILVLILGAITGWFTGIQIGFIGFIGTVILAGAKELIWDKLLGKGNPDKMDFIITVMAAFCSTFFFVTPILTM